MNTKSQTKTVEAPRPLRRYFTVEQADMSLTYVSKITHDIRASYRRAVELQERLDETPAAAEGGPIRLEYEATISALNRYVDELNDVGVELKDYEIGLVDFPAMHEGRQVSLCWKHGEKKIAAWHELDAGFSGRKPVDALTRVETKG